MKHAKLVFLLIIFAINTGYLFAQGHWVQTNGPSGGITKQILITQTGNIFSIGNKFSLTTDQGKKWTDIPPADSFLYRGPFTLDSLGEFALLSGKAFYRGINNGLEWDSLSKLPNHPGYVNIQTTPSGDLIATDDGGQMIYSSNRGLTWESIQTPNPNFFDYSPFNFDTASGIYTFTDVGFYRSQNKGESWSWVPYRTDYDRNIFSSVVTNRGEIYLSTMGGHIYYSPDLGKTWSIADDNLDSTYSVSLFAAPNGDISAIIKDGEGPLPNGIVIRPYNSKHWYSNNASLPHTDNLNTIAFSLDGTAYLGTNGDGVWKYEGTFNKVNEQKENLFYLSVYPNPAFSSFINLNYKLAKLSSPLIRIYSIAGTCIKELLITNAEEGDNSTVIDLSGFSPGTYFIDMQVGEITRREIVELLK